MFSVASVLKSISCNFDCRVDPTALSCDSIPTVDFSLLTSGDPDQRSKALHGLHEACQEWGFFILVNHEVKETLMYEVIDATRDFFELPEEEKKLYETNHAMDPIHTGNFKITDTSKQTTFALWREHLKLQVHPNFHYPEKPLQLREIVQEYSEKIRNLTRILLEAVSQNLGLEQGYMDEVLKLDSSFQLFTANLYQPCPQPNKSIGLPSHTDYGLLTFLMHNGIPGLQIERNGQWFRPDWPEGCFFVNIGDQLEIFSNGRYKSLKHRAVVNAENERISIVIANGPSLDTIVEPPPPLVQRDGCTLYRPMKYDEFMEKKSSSGSNHTKPLLEQQMIPQK